jgi:thiol-disulfide isomerase/thioredoxin
MNNRFLLYALIFAGAGAAGFVTSSMVREPAPDIATPVPLAEQARAAAAASPTAADGVDFTLANLAGGESSFSDWAGQPRMVNFWATWCAPCRREIPLLNELQASNEVDLRIIGVAVDDMPAVAAYAEEMPFSYPVLVGDQDAIAAAEAFGIEFIALPFTLLISADGELLKAHVGELHPEQADAMLEALADMARGALTADAARERLREI